MKFGKLLGEIFGEALTRGEAEAEDDGGADVAEGHGHRPVLRYKALKKFIKALAKHHGAPEEQQQQQQQQQQEAEKQQQQEQQPQDLGPSVGAPLPAGQLSPDEALFVRTLNEDLDRLNTFFMEREEEAVIKLQALSDRIKRLQDALAKAQQPPQQQPAGEQQQQQQEGEQQRPQTASPRGRLAHLPPALAEEAGALSAELVDLHGEMVLLQHWSMLNYSGVVKIIKKHDKHSDILMRAPYLESVLQQPFYSHGVMCRLVRTAEQHIDTLAASGLLPAGNVTEAETAAAGRGRARAEVFKQTQQALETWRSMRETAKTPSTVLPAEGSDLLRQLHARERWQRIAATPVGGAPAAAPAAGAAGAKRGAEGAAGEGEGEGGEEGPAAKRRHGEGDA